MLRSRVGFEIELLAPPGKSRLELAQAIARKHGGTVRRFFHPQSEPSKVPGQPVFENLTLGFEVRDANGCWVASCVDDLTLQHDLRKSAAPVPGWYRILSDDSRLLSLISLHAEPEEALEKVLEPLASLFGTDLQTGPDGMRKVTDRSGKAVAIAAPLPGERERPCELVTAPIDCDHEAKLESLLALAGDLGFTAPQEGATHLHFDGKAFQQACEFARLVQVFSLRRQSLRQLAGVNPHCRRLGEWPAKLLDLVGEPTFNELTWEAARAKLEALNLSKYCDFNLLNLVTGRPDKTTFEIRILPVFLTAQPIIELAIHMEELLTDSTRL